MLDEIGKWLAGEWLVISHAPFAYLAAVFATTFLIWRAMEWRYGGQIERLRDELASGTGRSVIIPVQNVSYDPPVEQGPEPKAVEEVAAERIFLSDSVTPAFLAEQRKGMTTIQASQAQAMYIGKWIKYTAEVRDIDSMFGDTSVKFVTKSEISIRDTLSRSVIAYFDGNPERVSVLHVGDTITVQGQITDISDLGLLLAHCELI